MKKRAYGVLILLLIFSFAASACSGSGNKSGNGASSDHSGNNDYTLSAPGQLPLVDKKTTIKVTVPRSSKIISYEYGKNDLTTWLEDQTNVHVEWNIYPSADAGQKLNLELSSGGDVGDVLMGFDDAGYAMDNAMIANYGAQGIFQPLNDLIDKNGFYINKMYEENPNMKPATTAPDGNIYSLHKVGKCYNCDRAMRFWVNQDFLKALNMAEPTTTEELYQYLKAVKENDVNGNGDPNDEIPLTGSPKGWYTEIHDFILNAFTYKDDNDLFMQDDVVHAAFASDEWKEGLKYLNKLYSEGLIDPSAFTNDTNQLNQLIELNDGNTVGAFPGGVPYGVNDSTKLRYEALAPIKGPNGFQYAYFNEYGAVNAAKFVVPANAKNKDLVLKWIDFMYSPDASLRSRYGVPGVQWEKPEEGKVAANGGQAQIREIGTSVFEQQHSVHWDGANNVYTPFGSDAREKFPDGQFDLETLLYNAAVVYDKYTKVGTMVPPFYFGADMATKFNQLKTEINKYVESATADFIVGNRNIDKEWDKYLADLKRIGLDDYMKIMQDEYDKSWKK